MTNVFDRSEKRVIAGPITLGDDAPVTKHRAESDGRTFWAYNGSEVFYEDERLYAALDRIVELEQEVDRQKALHLERTKSTHSALTALQQERDELKAFQQAIFEAGLIQFGDNPETRCYSVWGFSRWHHDPDLLTAIRAVNEDLTP